MSKQTYQITINGNSFQCPAQTTVLLAMKNIGAEYLPVGCCGGGCGICKVRVIQGSYDTKVMSRAQVSECEEKENIALACRILPNSDLVLETILNSSKSKFKQ